MNALIQDSNENSTPDVLVAQARLQQAQLDLERTEIKAPFDGVVTRRNIQVGQRIAPGTSLMMVVPVSSFMLMPTLKKANWQGCKRVKKLN